MRKGLCVAWVAVGLVACGLASAAEKEVLAHFQSTTQLMAYPGFPVLRIDLDLTGDGTKELLLGFGRRSQRWVIYSRVATGQFRMLGTLSFSHSAFRLSQPQNGPPVLVVFEGTQDEAGFGQTVEYRVAPEGIAEVSRGSTVPAFGADDFAKWRSESGVKVLWIDSEVLFPLDLEDDAPTPAQVWKDWATGGEVAVEPVQGVVVLS